LRQTNHAYVVEKLPHEHGDVGSVKSHLAVSIPIYFTKSNTF